jgi:O-antigen ligase
VTARTTEGASLVVPRSADGASAALAQRLLAGSVGLWACGVQLHEALATAGAVSTALLVVVYVPWRQWWPIAAWLGFALLVPLLGGHLPTGTGLARLGDWLLWPCAVVALARLTQAQRERVGAAVLVTTVLTCTAAALQHVGLWPPLSAFQGLEWTKIPFIRMYEPIPGTDRFMAGGLMFHRLKFAHVTGLVAVWAIATRRPLAVGVGVVALLSVLVFPHARSGAFAAAVAVAFVVFERRRLLGVAVAAACALVVLAVPSVRERFATSLTGEGNGERVELWKTGLAAVEDHPLTGIGAGRFRPDVYASATTPQLVIDNWGKAHNQLLSLAAELGIPGALAFLAMIVLLRRRVWWPAMVHLAALSFVHDPLFHETYSAALMLALATRAASPTSASAETSAASAQSPRSPP